MHNIYGEKPMRLVSLSPGELNSLADLFSYGSNKSCLQALLLSLPDGLKRPELPEPWTQYSINQFYRGTGVNVSLPASLCKAHEVLNAARVQDVLAGVLSEADEGIEELINSLGGVNHIPERLRHRVLDETQAFLAADVTITEGEFYHFHGRNAPSFWWDRRNLYPCCILSKVANTESLLSALRSCLLARLPDDFVRGQKHSMRLAIIEAWIYAL